MASGIRDTLAAWWLQAAEEDGDDVSKKDAVRYPATGVRDTPAAVRHRSGPIRAARPWTGSRDVLAESGIDFRHEIDEKHEG